MREMINEEILDVVNELMSQLGNSVLIGGWASYAHLANVAMSKDIDTILDPLSDLQRVLSILVDVSESHLRKIRGTYRGVHVDLYVPHRSRLGPLNVVPLLSHTIFALGWRVLVLEAHILTKMVCLLNPGRVSSTKGAKDVDEITKMLECGVDPHYSVRIWREATSEPENTSTHFSAIFDTLMQRSSANGRTKDGWRRAWLAAVADTCGE